MNIFLDTSIIIDYLRQSNNPDTILTKLSKKYDHFYVSDITIAELFSGKFIWRHPEKKETLEKLLSAIKSYPTTKDIAILAGKIRAKYNIALLDAIIAATAIQYKLPLATFNTKDFSPISLLEIINILDKKT